MKKLKFRFWNNDTKHYEYWNHAQHWESLGYYLNNENIDGYIPEQFTGLKDKNDVEIYMGDIIQINHPFGSRSYTGAVNYGTGRYYCKGFCFTHYDVPDDIFSEGTKYIEVIGNIHNNPELLK